MTAVPGYRETPSQPWHPDDPVDPAEAEEFVRLHHREHPEAGSVEARLGAVRAEIGRTGTYTHTPAELTFGARVAWRNASRCIGRLYWRSLLVLDRRTATGADQIYHDLVSHLRITDGDIRPAGLRGAERQGRIRPVISVFPPARPGEPYARVWNEQLIRYAGYRRADGTTVGDPRYVDFTTVVGGMGWCGKGEAFDVLPLVVETPQDGVRLFELPEDAVREVPLEHPEYPWFAALGLRWHAVPAISNMRLSIGSVQYPLAPFNGWYLGTEIGARNLADPDRYDLLPVVAHELKLDTSRESTLWRDQALVELNRAVLWSFERAGVKITDHHTEARRFIAHLEREQRHGRTTPADWTWIVPPMSGAATAVFHRYYEEADQRPNFYLDPVARDLGRLGRVAQSPVVEQRRCEHAVPTQRRVVLGSAVPPVVPDLP